MSNPLTPLAVIESVASSSPLKARLHATDYPPTVRVALLRQADARTDLSKAGHDFTSGSNDGTIPTLTNNGGAIASGVPVQLLFWGSVWNLASTSPSAGEIATAVQSILAGPFMSGLVQYGIDRSPFRGALVVTLPAPPFQPHTFSDSDVEGMVGTLIDDGVFPEPDEDGGRIMYVVIMPPGTQYEGDPAVGGAHWYFSSGSVVDVDHAWYAWVGNHDIDSMTKVFGHELVEMCTDPEGDGWTVDGQPDGLNEIGDICNKSFNPLNGVLLENYWSQVDAACILPTAYSLKRFMRSKGFDLGKGVRPHVPPNGSVRAVMGIKS